MKKFVLFWVNGTTSIVEAESIADACRKSGTSYFLRDLNRYEVDGRMVQVSGQAQCGCIYHAEQGLSCKHDLKLAGL